MQLSSLTTQTTPGPCTGAIQLSTLESNFASCIGFVTPPVLSNNNTVVTLTPSPALSYSRQYKIKITTAALDSYGNAIEAEYTTATGFNTQTPPANCSASVVISQIYGGGGLASATYKNDYVELHNSSATTVDLSTWSIQYAKGASGTSWSKATLSGTIASGAYYLIQLGSDGTVGSSLPTSQVTAGINMGAASGKVALVNSTTTLTGECPSDASIVDWVAYGTDPTCPSGGNTAAISKSTAALRNDSGCTDTNNNASDFTVGTPAPRNASTTVHTCSCSGEKTANETGVNEINWCVLQSPPTLTVAASQTTDTVYGRVYQVGVTPNPATNPPNLKAQVGYGPANINPTSQLGWTWSNATYNSGFVDTSNDEFMSTMTAPSTAGSYRYTFRFSVDGLSWTYCDTDGAGADGSFTFDLDKLGVMTVN
jgi:hypothetical protein